MMNLKLLLPILLVILITSCNSQINEYWENGNIKTNITYVGGDKTCYQYKEFFESGKLKLEATYLNKKLHGDFIQYYEKGNVKLKRQYVNGLIDGIEIKYKDDGTVRFQSKYQKSKLIEQSEF